MENGRKLNSSLGNRKGAVQNNSLGAKHGIFINNQNSKYSKPDPIATSYFTRAGITNVTEMKAVNAFIAGLRNNPNCFASFQNGAIYLVSPTSYGASLHNLMSSSYQLSLGSSPTYSPFSGWSFNGVDQYLRTGFVPSTAMTINTGYIQFSTKNTVAGSTFVYGSIITGGASAWEVGVRNGTDLFTAHIYNNTAGSGLFTVSNTNSSGNYAVSITSNTNRFIRRNNVSLGTTSAAAGGALPAFETYIGCRNVNGTAAAFYTGSIFTLSQGLKGLSAGDSDYYTSLVDTYNANVVLGGR